MVPAHGLVVPRAASHRTTDLDEARAICGQHFYPRSLRLLQPSTRLAARFHFLRLGELTLGDVAYGADVAGRCPELAAYHVNLPLSGKFVAHQGRRTIVGSAGQAGVYEPGGEVVLDRSSADCRFLALKIERAALEGQLTALLDTPVRGPLRLAQAIDVTREPGRSWARLFRLLAGEISNPGSLAFEPIVMAPLRESLLVSLLLAVGHNYRDALERTVPRSPRRSVTNAIEAIQNDPRHPHTTGSLAQIAGISARRLQETFHHHVGMPPMVYLRHVRMARAHAELMDADPERITVSEVARRWGFAHRGRFSAGYRARYHASPSETLHGR